MRTNPSTVIPTSDSTAEMWVNWHKSLRDWFTKTEANTHWLRFWNQRAGAGTEADTVMLRSYMRDQGVDLTTTTMGQITDSAAGALDWFSDTINMTRILIFGTAIVGVALIAFFIISSTRQGKSATAMVIDAKSLASIAK